MVWNEYTEKWKENSLTAMDLKQTKWIWFDKKNQNENKAENGSGFKEMRWKGKLWL